MTNRLERLLDTPGTTLPAVRLDGPASTARTAPPAVLAALVRLAAERFAGVVDDLRPEAWTVSGRVGEWSVTVADLVMMPLHRSHCVLLVPDPVQADAVLPRSA